jgi:hypothetical protein
VWCKTRFIADETVCNAINRITRNAGLTPDKSPYLELSAEAWDEPRLLAECPHCHTHLRFNPFMVDNRAQYG